MKVVSILFAVLFSANAMAAEALVVITSGNMLNGTTQTITLKDDGYVYTQESSYIQKSIFDYQKSARRFARVQSEQQLANILSAIEKVPANAQLSKPDFELCEIDGVYSVQIFNEQFNDGALTIKTADCGDGAQIVGKNAQWARALVRMIESSWNLL